MKSDSNQILDDYSTSARLASRVLTETFSSSFGSAIQLFDQSIRQDIYNIYGLVRVADEIVDTYQGKDAGALLTQFEQEVYDALERKFSPNIIIQAFVETADEYHIGVDLLRPFFASMRMDLTDKSYTRKAYDTYIYGSAEVVGLMCLRVFVDGDEARYAELSDGAKALGAAFQKVNFLRDIRDDFITRGRYYFPYGSFESFDDNTKDQIIDEITNDFSKAKGYVNRLPKSARGATQLAFRYYSVLLNELRQSTAADITTRRLSVNSVEKFKLRLMGKLSSYVS